MKRIIKCGERVLGGYGRDKTDGWLCITRKINYEENN